MSVQNKILCVFLIVWVLGSPAISVMVLEMISHLKYAPYASFWNICILGASFSLPVLYIFLKKLKKDGRDINKGWVYIVMFIPLFMTAFMHFANVHLVEAQTQEVILTVEDKSRMRRKPRGKPSYMLYKIYFQIQDAEVFGKTMNGRHYVFVKKTAYDALRAGDEYVLTFGKGLLGAHYTLDIGDVVTQGR